MTDTPTLNTAITREIRAELARQKRAHSDFALECGLSASALSRRMTGDIPWSIDEIETAAKVLGLPLDQLTTAVRQ